MKFLSILLLLLFAATRVPAQTKPVDARLTGRVADRRGDAINAARVTIKATRPSELAAGRAIAQTVMTDSNGQFSLALAPDNYELSVMAAGFTEFNRLISAADFANTLKITLDPAALADQLVVTATRAAVRLADAPASVSLLDARDVQRAAAQTVDDLLRQVPGLFALSPVEQRCFQPNDTRRQLARCWRERRESDVSSE